MRKYAMKFTAVFLSILLLFSAMHVGVFAADHAYGPYDYAEYWETSERSAVKSASMSKLQKGFYNVLNHVANVLLRMVCAFYPNPSDWKDIDAFDGDGYLPGRQTYATEAAQTNVWRLGYASRTIIPDDFESGKYYIGRDLTRRLAKGINDDNRVRAVALDDNSGEGIVVFAAVDALGVTSADTLNVRKTVLAWAENLNIKVAAVNLSATHSHSAIDAQGVATESIYKLLTGGLKNAVGIEESLMLKNAEKFKSYYVNAVTCAVEDAILSMQPGQLYYGSVDSRDLIEDKRGLIDAAELPDFAVFKFVPDNGAAGTYIADIACHPTAFSADHGLFSGDYIFYLEQRLQEKTGGNFLFLQGASGKISRSGNVNTEKLPAQERMGATSRYMGKTFADAILAAEPSFETLSPVLNVKYTNFTLKPENYILILAVKARLVNNQVYKTGKMPNDIAIVLEEGYVELGGRVGLCLFPVELYPEVFLGTQIINGGDYTAVSWDGGDWDYPAPVDMAPREGIDMVAVHLTNDSLGYCLPDNNFAFLGHILGDGIADETLSLGQHTASQVVTEFQKLMDSIQ
ncbi:MAG: hypothetical protein IJ766_10640 [Clostridia bacterium]|nr:hypothetical protein [Clostridia bacterium]